MTVLFIGGDLDGELREVGQVVGYWAGPGETNLYHIANGIARHESVSEEEVARMVAAWREAWKEKHLVPLRHPEFGERHPDKVKIITVSNPDGSDVVQRYMKPQFPGSP
jgi:hypothetical protein